MIQAALRNPYLVIVMSLAIAVLGGFAYGRIPADLLPQFNISAGSIKDGSVEWYIDTMPTWTRSTSSTIS